MMTIICIVCSFSLARSGIVLDGRFYDIHLVFGRVAEMYTSTHDTIEAHMNHSMYKC